MVRGRRADAVRRVRRRGLPPDPADPAHHRLLRQALRRDPLRRHATAALRCASGRARTEPPARPAAAPSCDGVPTSTALWRLELTIQDGQLRGSYAESTLQSFDCSGTGVAWDLVLERR